MRDEKIFCYAYLLREGSDRFEKQQLNATPHKESSDFSNIKKSLDLEDKVS
jgi:hypothetical protein